MKGMSTTASHSFFLPLRSVLNDAGKTSRRGELLSVMRGQYALGTSACQGHTCPRASRTAARAA